jgi:hypothetical protein
MIDLATLQTYLAEAQTALHRLNTGQARVSVSYEGKSVTYNQASRHDLQVYIANLEHQIGELAGTVTPPRGPIHFGF